MRTRFLLFALVLASCQVGGNPLPRRDKPNVIFLLIDQVRTDALGAYGGGKNVTTPHIDRLAQQGVKRSAGQASPVGLRVTLVD